MNHAEASYLAYKMPESEQKPFQKRQVAFKVKISDILSKNFTKDEFSAGYIRLNEVNVSRVNIIATIVYKSEDLSYASAVIDDGTGRILLRTFGNEKFFSNIGVGDIVLVIGRIREFNNEKYILPEILKKVNIRWLNARKLELGKKVMKNSNNNIIGEEKIFDEEVYLLIKKLDNGDGVSIDDVIKSSNNSDVEKILNKLLANGDIFEIKPGKIKVLE